MVSAAQLIALPSSTHQLLDEPLYPAVVNFGSCGTQPSPASSSVSARSDDSGYGTDISRHFQSKHHFDGAHQQDAHCNRRRSRGSQFVPPSLPSQKDASISFVRLLICFSTGLIASIWPLSERGNLPLHTFISESLRRSKTSYSTLQVALYYIVLLKKHIPQHDFTQEQPQGGRRVAMQCGRRMFLSALILAAKYLQDKNYSTSAWEKITGLEAPEINKNERSFLQAIDYRLHVTKESFAKWTDLVLEVCKHAKCVEPQRPCGMIQIHQCRMSWTSFIMRLSPDVIDQENLRQDSLGLLLRDSFSISVFEMGPGMLPTPPRSPDYVAYNSRNLVEVPQACSTDGASTFRDAQQRSKTIPIYSTQHGLPTPLGTPLTLYNDPRPTPPIYTDQSYQNAAALPQLGAPTVLRCPPPSLPVRKTESQDFVHQPDEFMKNMSSEMKLRSHAANGAPWTSPDFDAATALLSILSTTQSSPTAESVPRGLTKSTSIGTQRNVRSAGTDELTCAKRKVSDTISKPWKRRRTSSTATLQERTRTLVMNAEGGADDVIPDKFQVHGLSEVEHRLRNALRNNSGA